MSKDFDPYVRVYGETHYPNKSSVYAHIVVVETVLGRNLKYPECVHHVNEIKTDNRHCNLVVLANRAEHNSLHRRLRVLRAGGNPWTQRMCCFCHQPKDVSEFYAGVRYDCKPCAADYQRALNRTKRKESK